MDTELRALAANVDVPLDYTFDSLAKLEPVLTAAVDRGAPPDEMKPLKLGVARYIGEVFRLHVGGKWELCEDPDNADYGDARVLTLNPLGLVNNFLARGRPGLLKSGTEVQIPHR